MQPTGARLALTDADERFRMTAAPRSVVAGIVWGGLSAGTVDVGAACLINGLDPVVILQAIASGVLGREAFRGGLAVAALGYGLQCAMSVVIAACYATGMHWLPAVRARWLGAGPAFGVVVFAVMNYLVVPLSAVGHPPHFTPATFVENLLAMLLFGVIIAYWQRADIRSWRDGLSGGAGPGGRDPALDEALEESFPASDPVAIHVDTESPAAAADAAPGATRGNR